jgi:hypothetical protein
MRHVAPIIAASAALLLCAFPLVTAHDDHESMDHMDGEKMNPSTPTGTPTPQASAMASSYFSYSEHVGLILAHVAFMVIGWFFVLPVCMSYPHRLLIT